MSDEFQKKVEAAIKNPTNMGEMADADSIGTVGSANCGDMLRVWVKYKEDGGRKIIDKATFQSFGCETAIAAASLAMEMIKGKTADDLIERTAHRLKPYGEALAITNDLAERDTVISLGGLAQSCEQFIKDIERVMSDRNHFVKIHNRREANRYKRR